jgi:hypothetical protein
MKDDPYRDDPTNDDNPDQKEESDPENGTILLLSGVIVGMLIVILVLLALFLKKRKGTIKMDKIKKDDWATCPKCGSSIRMGQLPSHLDTVHTKLTKKTKEKMIDQVTKRE